MKNITLSLLVLFSFIKTVNSQENKGYVSFRNCLNEGNYWFYEGNFDSAIVYYNKAEQFTLQFFPEELHLFSRTLWETGQKEKSIAVLQPHGLKDYFLRDTTYYIGLTSEKRKEIASNLKLTIDDLVCDDSDFYDSLKFKDQL